MTMYTELESSSGRLGYHIKIYRHCNDGVVSFTGCLLKEDRLLHQYSHKWLQRVEKCLEYCLQVLVYLDGRHGVLHDALFWEDGGVLVMYKVEVSGIPQHPNFNDINFYAFTSVGQSHKLSNRPLWDVVKQFVESVETGSVVAFKDLTDAYEDEILLALHSLARDIMPEKAKALLDEYADTRNLSYDWYVVWYKDGVYSIDTKPIGGVCPNVGIVVFDHSNDRYRGLDAVARYHVVRDYLAKYTADRQPSYEIIKFDKHKNIVNRSGVVVGDTAAMGKMAEMGYGDD